MKIAVIHFGKKGAGPVYTLEMAKALLGLGNDVFYYASSAVENKAVVEQQGFHKRFFDTYNTSFEYLFSVLTRYKINIVIKSIKEDSPDVVYSTMNDLWAPFVFSKLKGIQRVKTIHDVGVHEGNNSMFNLWWNNSNFKDAEKYVILSKKFVPKLVERGIKNECIGVIPHAGFDYYTHLKPVKEQKTLSPIMLFFGRIDNYKGIRVLLQAFPMVLNKHPEVILRIAGNGNLQNEMGMIELYSKNIDLQNRWIKDEEVGSLVEDASFLVLPYTHATQSGVIPLAYAFCKPVVATKVGCLDEQIIEGETGFLCEGSNAISLAEAINKMLDNPEMIKTMGLKANEYMRKYLTWEVSAKLFIELVGRN